MQFLHVWVLNTLHFSFLCTWKMSTPRKQTALSAAVSNNRATDGFSLLSTITRGFKAVGLAVAVWSWGYMGFSVAWLYVALFFHIINEEYRKIKDSKKAFAQRSLVDEKEAILSLLDEYPSWVSLWQTYTFNCVQEIMPLFLRRISKVYVPTYISLRVCQIWTGFNKNW